MAECMDQFDSSSSLDSSDSDLDSDVDSAGESSESDEQETGDMDVDLVPRTQRGLLYREARISVLEACFMVIQYVLR